jgi:Rha family phage regulatory protein
MLVEVMMIGKVETSIATSLDIAETFGKEHKRVLQDIRELECSEDFRRHNFVQSSYVNSQNKKQPMYYVTRDGFTLLAMGYTGEKAMKFKEGYIRQFNAMEKLLIGKIKEREKGIAVRQAFTKAIQQSSENERMHGHAYSTYTDVIYKSIFGKNAKQLREDFGISRKENMRDCFSEEDLVKIQNAEMLVSALVGYGWGYNEIKEFILNKGINKIAA